MTQLTIRLDDDLARQAKAHAEASGHSVNRWITDLVRAATDPELEGSDVERTRARLRRAGLLVEPERSHRPARPEPELVARAREAAGRGVPLSELVSEGRGEL